MRVKKCPVCEDSALAKAMTKKGVEVDFCPECHGIWLEKDDIYHFTANSQKLQLGIKEAMEKKFLSMRRSPVAEQMMFELPQD